MYCREPPTDVWSPRVASALLRAPRALLAERARSQTPTLSWWQLLFVRRKPDRVTELPSDPTLTLREDRGVTKVVPIHLGRAAESSAPCAASHRNANEALPIYTMTEVAEHCTRANAWVVIDERVYDVTRFVDEHPGGVGPMVNLAGTDCTDVFANYHAARIYKMLPAFLVGRVASGEVQVWPHVADFRRVRQELLRRGLFETDMGYYAKMLAWHGLLVRWPR